MKHEQHVEAWGVHEVSYNFFEKPLIKTTFLYWVLPPPLKYEAPQTEKQLPIEKWSPLSGNDT